MDCFYLTDLPMPPSENHAYATIKIKGSLRRIKSKELRVFEAFIEFYRSKHADLINEAKKFIEQHPKLSITTEFYFEESRLFCIDGRIKKLDASNRVKAANDSIAKMLGIDDSRFFESIAIKTISCGKEHMVARIRPFILGRS